MIAPFDATVERGIVVVDVLVIVVDVVVVDVVVRGAPS